MTDELNQPAPAEDEPWPEQGPNIKPNKSPEERIEALLDGDVDTEELPERHKTSRPIVVGLGASAGGLETLSAFFEVVPPDTGMTFVVVTHLSPDHKSVMDELLQRHTRMPVTQVLAEQLAIEPDHVYVIPPNRQLVLADTHLFSQEFEGPRAGRAPIDIFFRSLAAMHENPVALLLTGGGTDGALGLRSVKEAGGLVMVQDPTEALHDSMPRAAISTGIVDLVLPVREMARKLVEVNRRRVQVPTDPQRLSTEQQDTLQRILTQLQTRSGHDFRAYKQTTVLRRIQRRMQISGYETLEGYLNYMRHDTEEGERLLADLLIGVTNFFRDEASWKVVEESIIPELFAGRKRDETVRVWSVGCSTGEEAYTLAILLMEHAERLDVPPAFQVFATDLDESSLAKAREGFYPDAIAADVSAERLQRFFVHEGAYYRVRREVRDNILFATHSVLRDPPFSRLDLIVCRNLLIYLQRPLQDTLFEVFYYALRPGGILFLGNSETADGAGDLFLTVDKKHRVYRSRSWTGQQPVLPTMPLLSLNPRRPRSTRPMEHRLSRMEPPTERVFYEQTLEEYGPPTVMVDDESNIIRLSGDAGRYLLHPDGPPTNNLTRLIRPELQFELRSGLFQAFEKDAPSVSQPVTLDDNPNRRVFLSVWPRVADEQRLALVIFMEDQVSRSASPEQSDGQEGQSERATRQLEEEVRHLRDRLQATIEEYETSNEELKAANEELQSINEEYRSTTEELETSKEELQSVNEELETVNNELKNKLDEISRAHSDLQNLMAATEIATLFLDRDLRVQSYTERAEEIFNIMKSDRGRPIEHLTHRLAYPELGDDARLVLRTLVPLEREVERGDGAAWYLARLRPYRTLEDRIEGVVLTFVDVTLMKQTEQALRRANRLLDMSLGAAGMGRGIWDIASGAGENDSRLSELLGYPADQYHLTLEEWLDRVHPDDRPALEAAIQTASEEGSELEMAFRVVLPSGETRYVQSAGVFVAERDGGAPSWTGLVRDVTDRVLLNRSLEEARDNLQLALWSANLGWGIADLQTGQLEQDLRARQIIGWPPDRPLTVAEYIALIHPDDVPVVQANAEGWAAGKMESAIEYRVIRADGEVRTIRSTGRLRHDAGGNPWQVTGTLQDVTELRRDEAELRRLTGELEALVAQRTASLQEALDELAVAHDRFQQVFDANPVPKVLIDVADGTYADANPSFMAYMGLEREQIVGRRADEALFQLSAFENADQLQAEYEQDGRLLDVETTFDLHPGDGRTVLMSLARIMLNDREMMLAAVIDITERKRAEQQIRRLASELTRAEERERKRVSGILHDDLQQRLYALQIELLRLREMIARSDEAGIEALFDKVETLVPETINTARDLSIDLSPPILEGEGITEAVQWLATNMGRQYGLHVQVNAAESFPLADRGLRIGLFQAVRELLFNVVKHAGQTQANVSLARDDGRLVIEVKDEGAGFDPQQGKAAEEGHGLTMARQRLGLFGGSMDIESAAKAGTRVVISVPLSAGDAPGESA